MTLRALGRSFDFSPMARFGTLVAAAFFFAALSDVAVAEVCDKAVGDSWTPSDGPVWLLKPSGFPTGLAILFGWLALSLTVRKSTTGFFGAGIIALFFALTIWPGGEDNSIHDAMLREGCTSERTELWNAIILAVFALAYLAAGIRARRLRAKTV